MKTPALLALALCQALSLTLPAAERETPSPVRTITERGPHHRVWETRTTEDTPSGRVEVKNTYTELATGMHYKPEGARNWLEASDQIEITAEGARATRSQHTAYFRGNLKDPAAISILTPDGQLLRTSVLGLSYQDASGKAVFIAEVKESGGQLMPSGLC